MTFAIFSPLSLCEEGKGNKDRLTMVPIAVKAPLAAAPRADVLVPIRIALSEVTLRQQVKQLGGRWDPRRQVWEVRYAQAVALGLVERIIDSGSL